MELLGRRYGHIRVVDILGSGAMGDVYSGFDETLQRRVALKAIRPDEAAGEMRSRFVREARTLSQLDHPNICRIYDYIEGGDREADLLVLELIEGRTLEAAIREKLSHAEKLRIAASIASVLVTAHRAGIVHRDLKPENVMLTKSGDVKVLDFGLAHWTRVRTQPRIAIAGSNRGLQLLPNETAAGIAVGTPLYMSPEQARGETPSPASDLYSFGLLLQTLFTEREPYDPTWSAREVMIAASKGESLPLTGVDRDVAALILRLKQLAPTDRPTAAEALRRIEWIAGQPKRRARELAAAIALLVLIFGVWKYVVDLRHERTLAIAAREEADRRRAQADDLISFMLGDLRRKLQPVGRLDIMDGVANKSLTYVELLDSADAGVDELVRNSDALNQLGEVRIGQGKLAGAMTIFQRALRLADLAVKRQPANRAARLALATSHFWVGNAYRLQSDLPRALQHIRRYEAEADGLAAEEPGNETYVTERGYAHSAVGSILELQGALNGAIDEYRLTLSMQQLRLAAKPDDPHRRADVARMHNKLGSVLQTAGRLDEARPHLEAEQAAYASLHRDDPTNAYWTERLANSDSYVASLVEMLGDTDRALALRMAERELETTLTQRDRDNVTWQRNLAITGMRIGSLLRLRGDTNGALPELRRAESALAAIARRDAARAGFHRDHAVAQAWLAQSLLAAHRVSEAGVMAGAATAALRQLAHAEPADAYLLVAALVIDGEVRAAAHDANAKASWWEAVEAARSSASTGDPLLLDPLARALIHLGRIDEAKPIVAKLRSSGYVNAELESLYSRAVQALPET